MSFTSVSFLVFLAVFALLWPKARTNRQARWGSLTVLSFFFYGYWDWRFVFLLAGTGYVDYLAALAIERDRARRHFYLWASISTNLGVLFFFKYAYFVLAQGHTLLGWPSSGAVNWVHAIILPVGISFYTFQSMSYTIDVYRGLLRPTHNVLHFLAYLSLFPQLVAGPIIRAADLLPQLDQPGDFNASNRWRGLERVAIGFFKKLVIADHAAPFVNEVFNHASAGGGALWWTAALFFALQIYCDFSGYSDIAIGIARWMGYHFTENFYQPYSSLGFREFWSRWHISLSSWFRDYVYVPLGGSRHGAARSVLVLWITFLASGLWHGANWTFLAWGGVHASFLTFERLTEWPRRLCHLPGGRIAGIAVTFMLTCLAWVFFRAESLPQALVIVRLMVTTPFVGIGATFDRLNAGYILALLSFLLLAVSASFLSLRPERKSRIYTPRIRLAAVVVLLLAAVFLRGSGNEFIYFQF